MAYGVRVPASRRPKQAPTSLSRQRSSVQPPLRRAHRAGCAERHRCAVLRSTASTRASELDPVELGECPSRELDHDQDGRGRRLASNAAITSMGGSMASRRYWLSAAPGLPCARPLAQAGGSGAAERTYACDGDDVACGEPSGDGAHARGVLASPRFDLADQASLASGDRPALLSRAPRGVGPGAGRRQRPMDRASDVRPARRESRSRPPSSTQTLPRRRCPA